MQDERFEQAARAYGDMIFRVACHALADRCEAEDVTQTVLLRLYQQKEDFAGEEHLKHWLLRVAVNESRKVLRSPWRKRNIPLEDWDAAVEPAEDSGVLDAVMALEARYRLPVYLYYYEDLTVAEVAQVLKTNPSTVQTRLQRAREKLKAALTEEEKEETPYVRPKLVL